MDKINIHDAKTQFSRLVDRAAAGEEIVIAKAGKPVAKLVPLDATSRVRKRGLLKGQIKIKESFYAPLPDGVLAEFEGKRG